MDPEKQILNNRVHFLHWNYNTETLNIFWK